MHNSTNVHLYGLYKYANIQQQYIHIYKCMNTTTSKYTNIEAHNDTYTHMQTYTYTNIPTCNDKTNTYTSTIIHTYNLYKYTNTQIQKHTNIQIQTFTNIHIQTIYTYEKTQINKRTRNRIYEYNNAHICKYNTKHIYDNTNI